MVDLRLRKKNAPGCRGCGIGMLVVEDVLMQMPTARTQVLIGVRRVFTGPAGCLATMGLGMHRPHRFDLKMSRAFRYPRLTSRTLKACIIALIAGYLLA